MITLARTTIAIALLLALMLIGTIIGARAQSSMPRSIISGNQFCTYGNSGAQVCIQRQTSTQLERCIRTAVARYGKSTVALDNAVRSCPYR
jgi:hypothetical protein